MAVDCPEQPNLYQHCVRSPRSVRWLLHDQDVLTADDVSTVERWAKHWGWYVRLHNGIADQPQLIEVFGPEFGDPADAIGLIYRVRRGFQVDEWIGKSWYWPTLGEALRFAGSHL